MARDKRVLWRCVTPIGSVEVVKEKQRFIALRYDMEGDMIDAPVWSGSRVITLGWAAMMARDLQERARYACLW